jgi:hypothetical protein
LTGYFVIQFSSQTHYRTVTVPLFVKLPSLSISPVTVSVFPFDTLTEPVPVTVINGFTAIDVLMEYDPVIVSVLNAVVADPPMTLLLPVNVIVLVPAVNVPPLFVQLPLIEWMYDPAEKLVPGFKTASPVIAKAAPAVADAVPDIVYVPAMLIALAAMVFTPLPDNVRCPYDSLVTVCADPA